MVGSAGANSDWALLAPPAGRPLGPPSPPVGLPVLSPSPSLPLRRPSVCLSVQTGAGVGRPSSRAGTRARGAGTADQPGPGFTAGSPHLSAVRALAGQRPAASGSGSAHTGQPAGSSGLRPRQPFMFIICLPCGLSRSRRRRAGQRLSFIRNPLVQDSVIFCRRGEPGPGRRPAGAAEGDGPARTPTGRPPNHSPQIERSRARERTVKYRSLVFRVSLLCQSDVAGFVRRTAAPNNV